MKRFTTPEIPLTLLAFGLNLLWESLHARLFISSEVQQAFISHMISCSVIDVLITLGIFWIIAILTCDRRWILHAQYVHVGLFLALSVLSSIAVEYYNVYVEFDWAYTSAMPQVLGIGISPVLQWIIIPLILLFTVPVFVKKFDKKKNVSISF